MTNKVEKELDEAVTVGGGETGVSKTADPVGGKATLPKSNNNSEAMPKVDPNTTPGQSEQETDEKNNVKATADTAAANRASVSMKEDVDAMFNGEELSEEFKEKATTIFEAAVTSRVTELSEKLEAEYAEKLTEETAKIEAELSEQVEQYMDYTVSQWMEQNQVAIESSLKSEITEAFIEDLKGLFERHYITIPEQKIDVLEATQAELAEVQAKLDEALNANIELSALVNEAVRDEILDTVSEGLAATQAEKFATLAEGVTFEDADSFRKKLEIVKENYFPSEKATSAQNLLEEVQEDEGEKAAPVNSNVAMYMSAISRTIKK